MIKSCHSLISALINSAEDPELSTGFIRISLAQLLMQESFLNISELSAETDSGF